jgi:hypothetical protein
MLQHFLSGRSLINWAGVIRWLGDGSQIQSQDSNQQSG